MRRSTSPLSVTFQIALFVGVAYTLIAGYQLQQRQNELDNMVNRLEILVDHGFHKGADYTDANGHRVVRYDSVRGYEARFIDGDLTEVAYQEEGEAAVFCAHPQDDLPVIISILEEAAEEAKDRAHLEKFSVSEGVTCEVYIFDSQE